MDVFEKPGMSDLTTNVDFAFLKEALEGIGKFISLSNRNLDDCQSSETVSI